MFQGIHAVLYAMFDRNERIDPGAMRTQVDYCIDAEVHGITVPGLATEVLKLTLTERKDLILDVADAIGGRVPLSVGVAGNSIAEQAETIEVAEAAGAKWLILQPPMVGSYSAEVYIDFFAEVAAKSGLPVAIQNAPAYLGRSLSAPDIGHLKRRCPNFAAVKSEDCPKKVEEILRIAGKDLAILGGRGGLDLLDLLQIGCAGFVLAPDIAPVAVRIRKAWIEGNREKAADLYRRISPSIDFSMTSLEHLITYGKRIFAACAGLEVHDRSPCLSPTQEGTAKSEAFVADLMDILR
ncbi:dihydrodipicolinate synthase family protein [Thioalkalivibrio sp. HK1]|uniref:dihydrodipicolinate synthase family protein n=1 Tax=Thioalkalivibrio sp. HK1 TaxID=1469245 RepID=UPI00046FC5C0|nr:dihydrodipicolinate synthase family protein [Thioalkalivibrio sp. HK1]